MTRIVVVHGINNTYSAPEVMAAEWVPALLGGLTLSGHTELASLSDVTCAFYGDVFRRSGRFLGVEDLEALDPDDVQDPAEVELLAGWWGEAARTDPGWCPRARVRSAASVSRPRWRPWRARGTSPG